MTNTYRTLLQPDNQRYLVKNGMIVETVGKSRKLRHVFLFNDIIVCTKQKLNRYFADAALCSMVKLRSNIFCGTNISEQVLHSMGLLIHLTIIFNLQFILNFLNFLYLSLSYLIIAGKNFTLMSNGSFHSQKSNWKIRHKVRFFV